MKRRSGVVTRVRQQLLADREWFGSPHFHEYRRPAGVNESLYSYYALPAADDAISVIELYRALRARRFGERERQLVRLLHEELGPLIGRQLASARETSSAQLPPRLRQVLERLLEGDSEKQIARRLGISRPTVHEYVTALYRRFGVHSRGELLARWNRFDRNAVGARAGNVDSPRPRVVAG
ncbi:MAG: LuxR C-terminal-related transcriptional regulator [Planctomycetes bacterium]|nr:LuxR C-terminal-related transcriptional regulator [Planctomycetota bacterium]